MILALGLLTLLAVGHARAGHVKGKPAGDWTQEKLHQDDIPQPVIAAAPAHDAVQGWIRDPADALGGHTRVKTIVTAGAEDALHHVHGDHHGNAQTAATLVRQTPGLAANNPSAVKTVLRKTQILTQRISDPATTAINRQAVPITRSRYKVKTLQRTIPPAADSDSALNFVPGSPGSPVLIPGPMTIPQDIGPLGLGPSSADFGQRTRVITPALTSGAPSGNARTLGTQSLKPFTLPGQQPAPARAEVQRQASAGMAPGQTLAPRDASGMPLSPEIPPLPSAGITPGMVAAIEDEVGAKIITETLPGPATLDNSDLLSRIPTGLIDANIGYLPKLKLTPETPSVQNVDYRKDRVLLRPQMQGNYGSVSTGNIQFTLGNDDLGRNVRPFDITNVRPKYTPYVRTITPAITPPFYTGAGRGAYRPLAVQTPVRTSLPAGTPVRYETVRRTPVSAVVPPRISYETSIAPLSGNVPILGGDGNVFGNAGQVFEMSFGGKLTPVSDSRPGPDARNYATALKEKIRLSNEKNKNIVSTLRKPDVSQASLTTGGLPIQPFGNMPISGLDGNVQDHIGQVFEISSDGKVISIPKSPASVQPAITTTSPGKPPDVKPASQPPLSVSSLPGPRNPQTPPISRGAPISAPRVSLTSQSFGSRTPSYSPLPVLQRAGVEPPLLPGRYQTISGFRNAGVTGLPGAGLTGIQSTFLLGKGDALAEGIIGNELLSPISLPGLEVPPGFRNEIPFGTIAAPLQPTPRLIYGPRSSETLLTGTGPFLGLSQEIIAPGSTPQEPLPLQILSNQGRLPQSLPLSERVDQKLQLITAGVTPLNVPSIPGTFPRTVQIPFGERPQVIPFGISPQVIDGRTLQTPRKDPLTTVGRSDARFASRRIPQVPTSLRPPQQPISPSTIFQKPSLPRTTPQMPPPQRIPQKPLPPGRMIQRQPSPSVIPITPSTQRTPQVPPSSRGTLQVQTTPSVTPQVSTTSSRARIPGPVRVPPQPVVIQRPPPPGRTQQMRPSLGTISQIEQTEFPAPSKIPMGELGDDLSLGKVPISGVDGNIYGNVGQVFEMSSDGKLVPVSDSRTSPEILKPAPPRSPGTDARILQAPPQIAPKPQIIRTTTLQRPRPALIAGQRAPTRTDLRQTAPRREPMRPVIVPGNIQPAGPQVPLGQTIGKEEQMHLNIDDEIKYHPLRSSTSIQRDPATQLTGPGQVSVVPGPLNEGDVQQLVKPTFFSEVPQHSMPASQVPLLTRGNKNPVPQEQILEQILL